MKESPDESERNPPSAVDDAASVILESKRKEAFEKNASSEKNPSVSGLAVFVFALLLALGCGVIFF